VTNVCASEEEIASFSTETEPTFPIWHVAVLLGMLAGIVGLSTTHSAAGNGISHRQARYLVIAAYEWAMVIWIALGCHIEGGSLCRFLSDFELRRRPILRDSGLAVGFLFIANFFLSLLRHLVAATPTGALRQFLPHTLMEDAAYLALTVTASFCEELIYRGYLQRQFTAWTGSLSIGVLFQGIVFGASHAYQGRAMVLVVAAHGCLLGLLAAWRRSLRPGMIAHLFQDAVGGLILARVVLK
jgi:membrane protease YdiL (CAAX protease family)